MPKTKKANSSEAAQIGCDTDKLLKLEEQVSVLRDKLALPYAIFPWPADGIEKAFMMDPEACPYCGSNWISAEPVSTDREVDVLCEQCGAEWTEQHVVISANNFEEGDIKPKKPVVEA